MSDETSCGGRPEMTTIVSGGELRRWYWRKDELVALARHHGLKTGSNKFAILDRVAHFLDTGEQDVGAGKRQRTVSKFDWHGADLSAETVIDDNYRNTQNVRRFFKAEVGSGFRFNIAFMDWMRTNAGKTLGDACVAYREMKAETKKEGFRTSIREHNQFNQYTRDFLDDNPDKGMSDVRRIWSLKISQPSETGRHVYDPADLLFDTNKTT